MVVNEKMQLYREILREVETLEIPSNDGNSALRVINRIIRRLEEAPSFAQVLDSEPNLVEPFIHVWRKTQPIGVSYITNTRDSYSNIVGSASLHPLPGRGTCCDRLVDEFLLLEDRKGDVICRYMKVIWRFSVTFGWEPKREKSGGLLYEMDE